MTDARTDGRIILSVEPAASSEPSAKPVAVLRYILLNPAERFKEVVSEARSVVLAGGTMEPVRLIRDNRASADGCRSATS